MSQGDDVTRLRHMIDAARKTLEFTTGRTRADLDRDELLALALVRLLEIIGEAARHVSSHLREQYPSIPWREIAGTRDRLIHGYFDVDMDIVWAIVSADIPLLVTQLEEILQELHADNGPEAS